MTSTNIKVPRPHCAYCNEHHHTSLDCGYQGDVVEIDKSTLSADDRIAMKRVADLAYVEGRKDDQAKTWRPGLIAPEFIRGIATVLAFGAIKYAAGNWALGMDWSRPIDALDRHWTAWKGGEKYDPETGYSHLWHCGCCLMFLVAYEARGIGRDDRSEVGLMAKEKAA